MSSETNFNFVYINSSTKIILFFGVLLEYDHYKEFTIINIVKFNSNSNNAIIIPSDLDPYTTDFHNWLKDKIVSISQNQDKPFILECRLIKFRISNYVYSKNSYIFFDSKVYSDFNHVTN